VSRWWNELVGAVEGTVPLPLLLLLLFGAATLVALLWYFFPAWVPRRWPRLHRPRWRLPGRGRRWRWPRGLPRWRWPGRGWLRSGLGRLRSGLGWLRWLRSALGRLRWLWPGRWRRRKAPQRQPATPAPVVPAEEVPEVPAAEFASLADRLAAEGRYAEAVRERLRGMVRELIERGVVEHRPGWTVTELAAAAATRRPAVTGPLGEAGRIFSDVWYGQRPAGAIHDARMRALADALTESLRAPVGVGR
jgi:hypothetical protein